MKTIRMSKAQSQRMGTPQLEGEVLEVEMPTAEEIKSGRSANVAKDVYHDGKRIGGGMDIND